MSVRQVGMFNGTHLLHAHSRTQPSRPPLPLDLLLRGLALFHVGNTVMHPLEKDKDCGPMRMTALVWLLGSAELRMGEAGHGSLLVEAQRVSESLPKKAPGTKRIRWVSDMVA